MRTVGVVQIILAMVLLVAGVTGLADNACTEMFANKKGELVVGDATEWRIEELLAFGYTIKIEDNVYIGEGVVSAESDDYDALAYKGGVLELLIEVRDGQLYRTTIRGDKIAIHLRDATVRVGDDISSAHERMGELKIAYGEAPGTYFIPTRYRNISLYSECFIDSHSLGPERSVQQSLRECEIDMILLLGQRGRRLTRPQD